MPSAVVELAKIAGGGADVAAASTCRLTGSRAAATTTGPDRSLAGETTATFVKGEVAEADGGGTSRRASPLTAPANTRGAMTAMLSAGARVTRITWRLTAAGWNQFNDVTD